MIYNSVLYSFCSSQKKCPSCLQTVSKKNYERHLSYCNARKRKREDQFLLLDDQTDESDLKRFRIDDNPDLDSENVNVTANITIDDHDECISGNEATNSLDPNDNEDLVDEDFVDEQEFDDIANDFENLTRNDENQSRFSSFVCKFLAVWQRKFGITDTALEMLLKFLSCMLSTLINLFPRLEIITGYLPTSLYLFHKALDSKNEFIKYAVCIKCYKLYLVDDCVEMYQGELQSKLCTNILLPNHPQAARRRPCAQSLLMKVISPTGKVNLVPYKTFCYKPLKESLQQLLSRPGFEEKCYKWRDRAVVDGIMTDVYDGRIWKLFSDPENGYAFFNEDQNFGLNLNCDWFSAFKHVSYSIGAIYLVLMNLPRTERFLRENLILVGLIPAMNKEPPTNSFLSPLVEELKVAWTDGLNLASNGIEKNFHLALLCIGCDIPASRKLCGFLG